MSKLKQKLSGIFYVFPAVIQKFLLRAFIIFWVWKICYFSLLSKDRIIDQPLTTLATHQTAIILNFFHDSGFSVKHSISYHEIDGVYHSTPSEIIQFNGFPIVMMLDSCNGLELFVLYIGFILSMPVLWKRKLLFSIFGVLFLHFTNILRCVALAEISIHWSSGFDLAHHYLFNIVIYSTILLLWNWFSHKTINSQ